MTGKTAIVFTCSHTKPEVDNSRFDLLGKLIYDVRPDLVVDLGDGADMGSLSSYDTQYPKLVVAANYEKDISQYNDAQERLRHLFKKNKKKRPKWIGFEGNHENRIKKALDKDPRLEGTKYGVSFKHLETDYWFDEYHEYKHSAPALASYDGVLFGHYVAAGAYGRALSSKYHGAALVDKLACSATVGHSHKFHYHIKADARPTPLHGLVAGCFKGKEEGWAGQANAEWTKGVAIKRRLVDGTYDLEWVSMARLEEEYG